jgi:signal transduction histidine kinase
MLYFLALIFLLAENNIYSERFGFPLWIIPFISMISLIKAGIVFIELYLQVNIIEFEFTSIVNHTFRTPLTRIVWATKEIKESETNQEKLSYLQNIDNAAQRILNIVDILVGMQDVNNKSGYYFRPISVRQIIEESISKYRSIIEEKKFNFKIGLFNDIPPLTLDLKKMSFVFDALMENTLWYTPSGGNITISALRKKNHIVFYYSDSGIGLTWKDKRRLFSRFFRSVIARKMNTDGMGLSLYLSKIIIQKHGGKIYAKSKGKNKGSTFYIELPIDKKSGQIG